MIRVIRLIPAGWKSLSIKKCMTKTDINKVKTKILIQHYQRLGGPKIPSAGSPILKCPKSNLVYFSQFGKKLKASDYTEKPGQQLHVPVAVVTQVNKVNQVRY